MSMYKRVIALILALCLVLPFVPMDAFAVTTVTNPFTPDAVLGTDENGSNITSQSFRIPAMVTLSDGTLVAAADVRWNTTYDGGGLDTVVARSTNNGATWSYTLANYLGDNGNEYNSNSTCFIDPALAVTSDDTIYMLVDLYPSGVALNGNKETTPAYTKGFNAEGKLLLTDDGYNAANASYDHYLDDDKIYTSAGVEVPGYTVDGYFNIYQNGAKISNLFFDDSPFCVVRTGFLYLTKSTDKGATWSAPTLLNLKTDAEQVCLVGPGRGLVTSQGVIIFPVYSYKSVNNTEYKYTSLIYSTDNGTTWQRSASVADPSTTSEATMVELGNGKIRTFLRNDNATLCYSDFDLTTGTWGNYVNTGVKCNSDTELSAIIYSKKVEHNGKQKSVVLVSCPAGPNAAGTDNNNGAYRSSGKIFAGLIDPDTYEMTWLDKSVAVTPVATSAFSGSTYTAAQGFFGYSCLTEQKDNGSVSILYEDSQNGWGYGNGYGYTMDFKTYTESELETAFGVTFDTGDVSDGKTVNVTLEIGQTYEATIDNVALDGSNDDTTVATVTWTGTTKTNTKGTLLSDSSTVNLSDCEFTFTAHPDDDFYVVESASVKGRYLNNIMPDSSAMVPFSATAGKIALTLGYTDMFQFKFNAVTGSTYGGTPSLHFHTEQETPYWNRCGSDTSLKCYEYLYCAVKADETSSTEIPGYIRVTETSQIVSGENYLIAHTNGTNYYVLYPGTSQYGSVVQVDPSSAATEYSTDVTITGVAPGKTVAVVGNTQYNITVKQPDDVYVNLLVGESKSFAERTGYYMDGDPSISLPNAQISNLTLGGEPGKTLVPVTSIESGKQYLIVNKKTAAVLSDTGITVNNKTGLVTDGTASTDSTELWTITVTDAGYTVMQGGKYLTVAGYYANMSSTATSLSLAYTDQGWMILDGETTVNKNDEANYGKGYYFLSDCVADAYSGGALGTNLTNNEYIYWDIYEILPAHTEVTFEGVSQGYTTAKVGYTTYHITVLTENHIIVNYQADGTTVATENYDVLSNTSTQTLPDVVQDANGNFYTVSDTTLKLTAGTSNYNVPVTSITTENATVGVNESKTLQLSLVDGQYIVWTTNDPSYVTVAADYNAGGDQLATGTIIGNKITAANAPVLVTGTVYNEDGTVASVQNWAVTVTDSTSGPNDTTKYIYINITRIQNTTVYYSINGGELIEITDDMLEGPYTDDRGSYYKLKVPLLNEVYDGGFQISFFGAPDEGYALVEMASTNSKAEFYALNDTNHPFGLKSKAWPFLDTYEGYDNFDALVDKPAGDDGSVFDQTVGLRWGLAQGNLTVAQMKAMFANAIAKGADGALFFTRNKDGVTTASEDLLTDLQFVSTKLPEMNKQLNGVLPTSRLMADYRRYDGTEMVASIGEYVYFTITVTLDLPVSWNTDNPNKSALEFKTADLIEGLDGCYFYTKELDAADDTANHTMDGVIDNEASRLIELDITNDLNAEWTDDEKAAGKRVLQYFVVYPLKDTDIDQNLGNTVRFEYEYQSDYSGAATTDSHTEFANIHVVGGYIGNVIVDFGLAVSITDPGGKDSYGFDEVKSWTCTYASDPAGAPNRGTITINGTVLTFTPNEILKEAVIVSLLNEEGKSINSFIVLPASTVYYEEGFITYETGWTTDANSKGNGEQELQFATGTVSQQSAASPNNFGFDEKYANETGMSNGTQAVSTEGTRSTANFVFTGTGVDIYANCDTDTGVVYITLFKGEGESKTLVKLYQIATANGNGTSGATDGQAIATASLPILSLTDLEHGTYTIEIMTSSMRGEVRLDGFRVYNTLDAHGSYPTDEQNPTFIELRDEALSVQNVTGPVDLDQVFSESNKVGATVLYLKNDVENFDAEDLLNNGPKNELWLFEGETLTFTLTQPAQIGLKAPSGSVTYTVSVKTDVSPTETTHTITSATDMFYDVPAGTITIKATDGMLSVTKLKVTPTSTAALSVLSLDAVSFALRVMSEETHTHSYEATVTAPTCVDGGYTTYTCADCGDSYVADQTEPLGHDYADTVVPPTEEGEGYTLHVCQRCDHSYTDNFVSLVTYGDVSGDGVIDGRDLLKLKRYLANYDYETGTSTEEVSAGADINGDGEIDGRDLLKLKRYLANYDYETGTSTEPLGPQG